MEIFIIIQQYYEDVVLVEVKTSYEDTIKYILEKYTEDTIHHNETSRIKCKLPTYKEVKDLLDKFDSIGTYTIYKRNI